MTTQPADKTAKTPEAIAAKRMHTAVAILALYKPERLATSEFDAAFEYITTAARGLEGAYSDLKRAHLFTARGLSNGTRVLNRAVGAADASYTSISYASQEMRRLQTRLADVRKSKKVPSLSDLVLDLEALERDFASVVFVDNMLKVTTESLVLTYDNMSFDFGPFVMQLDMPAVARSARKPYEVYALDPRWTPSRDYCHPHVTGKDLCTGEGTDSAWRATLDCRLYDFFVIINQILSTYNPESPYVKLEVWVNHEEEVDEDHFTCESCEAVHHLDYSSSCASCSSVICDDCSVHCAHTNNSYCQSCLDNGECERSCDHRGGQDCAIEENDPCVLCGSTPTNDDIHLCQHAHRASTHVNSGINRMVSLCDTCAVDRVDELAPCLLTRHDASRPEGNQRVTEACTHFGEDTCTLVTDCDLEEGAIPAQSEEEAATAEQEVADAS